MLRFLAIGSVSVFAAFVALMLLLVALIYVPKWTDLRNGVRIAENFSQEFQTYLIEIGPEIDEMHADWHSRKSDKKTGMDVTDAFVSQFPAGLNATELVSEIEGMGLVPDLVTKARRERSEETELLPAKYVVNLGRFHSPAKSPLRLHVWVSVDPATNSPKIVAVVGVTPSLI